MTDMVRRTYIILTGLAFAMFLTRALVTMDGGQFPATQEELEKLIAIQPIVELTIMFGFLYGIVPQWAEKLKSKTIKEIVQYGAIYGGVAIIIVLFPEYLDLPWGEQRLIILAEAFAVMTVLFLISYWYGKKYKSGKKEESE